MIGVDQAAAVAQQAACRSELPKLINRGKSMLKRHHRELLAQPVEQRGGTNIERLRLQALDALQCSIKLSLRSGLNNANGHPKRICGRFQRTVRSVRTGAGWVDECRN